MREFKIFAVISDIHIGRQSISPKDFRKQLKEHFISVLKELVYLDGIFITGDILHGIISLNSEYAEVFYWFIDQVYKIARKKHSTVIIVRGTASHDNDQLNKAEKFESDDYRILVLPDVRVKQLKDIDQYLDKKDHYDMILGHGTIDRMQFFVQESEQLSAKTYLFDVDKLMYCCKGPIFFGHIHQYESILDHFYYVGSFTTLERGTHSAGFLVGGIYSKNRKKYVVNRYLNPDSAEYLELEVTKKLLAEYSIDDIMETIDSVIESMKENDLITLRITRGDDSDSADKILMLEDRYRKDKRFSIIKKVKSKKEEEVEQKNQELRDRYSYAFDQNLEMYEILYKYYIEDYVPSLSDPNAEAARITEEAFKRVLSPKST